MVTATRVSKRRRARPARERTAARKQPKQSRSQATVDVVLDAAAQLLVAAGYAATTTNRIAARAGVSIGTVYQYFATKDAVVAAVVDRHIARMRATLVGRLADVSGEPLEALARAMIRALFDAHAVEPGLHRAILEQLPRVDRRERLVALEREMAAGVAAAFRARAGALRPARPELAAVVVVQATTALAHAALFDDALRRESAALADEVTDLVLRYLTPR